MVLLSQCLWQDCPEVKVYLQCALCGLSFSVDYREMVKSGVKGNLQVIHLTPPFLQVST